MPATKLAFSSLPAPASAIPNFLAGQEADDLEQVVGNKVRERAQLLFEQSGATPGNDEANWLQAESEILRANVEIRESGTWVSLRSAISDASGQGMQIVVRSKRVLVRATKTGNEQGAQRDDKEAEGEILVVANLPLDVDPASAAGSFRDHNLHIMIKKTQPGKAFG